MTDAATTPALIALGSNIEPEQHLSTAVSLLCKRFGDLIVSSVWESEPVGFVDQPRFCNAAVRIESDVHWNELRRLLRSLEGLLGRVRHPLNKNAPRTIDLDIAMFGQLVINENGIRIPDPEIASREFLYVPLAEIAPDWRHPELNLTLADLAARNDGGKGLLRRDDLSKTLATIGKTHK